MGGYKSFFGGQLIKKYQGDIFLIIYEDKGKYEGHVSPLFDGESFSKNFLELTTSHLFMDRVARIYIGVRYEATLELMDMLEESNDLSELDRIVKREFRNI